MSENNDTDCGKEGARVLIHIGYPKSGSSTLQQKILSQHKDVNYLSGHVFADRLGKDAPEAFAFYKGIIGSQKATVAELRSIWACYFLPNLSSDKLNVISTEHIVQSGRPTADVAKDLKEVIGDAEILIVIRDQSDLLRSQYDMKPFVENDPQRKYTGFSEWLDRSLAGEGQPFVRCLQYARVARTYAQYFGAARINLVSFTKLFKEPEALMPLCEKLGIDGTEFIRCVKTAPRPRGATNNSYKKITRRLLGGTIVADYLPSPLLNLTKAVLRKSVRGQRTEISPKQHEQIATFYTGERPTDLTKSNFGSVIVG